MFHFEGKEAGEKQLFFLLNIDHVLRVSYYANTEKKCMQCASKFNYLKEDRMTKLLALRQLSIMWGDHFARAAPSCREIQYYKLCNICRIF